MNEPSVCYAKYKFDFSAKFILRFLECKIYFAVFGVQNLFCGFWSAKFILRFDFLDITVRHEIGKRYINALKVLAYPVKQREEW
ncbi:hypothetical protein BGS_1288 [Beggiatoa sp. SS]|nr:hypothetical protein BGS_1288 [Beggiatoa sp. SS]